MVGNILLRRIMGGNNDMKLSNVSVELVDETSFQLTFDKGYFPLQLNVVVKDINEVEHSLRIDYNNYFFTIDSEDFMCDGASFANSDDTGLLTIAYNGQDQYFEIAEVKVLGVCGLKYDGFILDL